MPPRTSHPTARAKATPPCIAPAPASEIQNTTPLSAIPRRSRAVIENVSPEINAGRYPIKRVPGEKVLVEADIFADGHDVLSAVLKFRHTGSPAWSETAMQPLVNDRWRGEFTVTELGEYCYTLEAWVDHFKSWRHDTQKKLKAVQDISVELLMGAQFMEEAATRAESADAASLKDSAKQIRSSKPDTLAQRADLALGDELAAVMDRYPDRRFATCYDRELRVVADPALAQFGAWYEMFPRSCPGKVGAHGTFKDVEAHLPRISAMGFDVLYFPPIHPIGTAFRKGKNNNPICRPGEPGSPWGIGTLEGGHKAIHPELGTLEDFKRLVTKARELKIEIALDIAWQCSPEHPWVHEHPEWFKKRPDGSIQYAENPPKKYQDIYPIDFESENWQALWQELKSVIDYWIEQGVRIFRVDNPHTKALPFWEWMIGEVKTAHPETVFLSEAFTRPKLMYNLAKRGFTQSYNYFPWRNTKWELTEYFKELTRTEVKEYFRPNLWPNTPDILTQYLQYGGRPAFMARLILVATLGASYGIYGPAFELCVNKAREIGSEEYLDSEKYEIRNWDLNQPGNLTDLIGTVNRVRHQNPALHSNDRLEFHAVDNEQLIAYSKTTPELDNIILMVVNLDPHHVQSGWVNLSLDKLGIERDASYQVHDVLSGARYLWHGARNYVELNPSFFSAHVFRVRRHVRTERDFDYFL
jgi:starch synthase (maltosyl-transferring)